MDRKTGEKDTFDKDTHRVVIEHFVVVVLFHDGNIMRS